MIDIVILAFIALQIAIGYFKGLVKSLFDFFGYILAAIITYLFHKPVESVLIETTSLDEKISEFVMQRLQALGSSSVQAAVSTADLDAMQKLPLPDSVKGDIVELLTNSVPSVTQNVTSEVTAFLMNIFSVFIVFIVALIAIKIIASMLGFLAELPVIRSFNKLGGVAFGLLKSYVIISLLFLVAIMIYSTHPDPVIQDALNKSYFAPFFINYNVFLMVFKYIPS